MNKTSISQRYYTVVSVPLKGIETTNLLQHIPTKSLAFWGCNDFLTEKWGFFNDHMFKIKPSLI